MSAFPIRIKIRDTGDIRLIHTPEDLPIAVAFYVLELHCGETQRKVLTGENTVTLLAQLEIFDAKVVLRTLINILGGLE